LGQVCARVVEGRDVPGALPAIVELVGLEQEGADAPGVVVAGVGALGGWHGILLACGCARRCGGRGVALLAAR
jgi:hypothetical protein